MQQSIDSLNSVSAEFQIVKSSLNNTSIILDDYGVPLSQMYDMRIVQGTAKKLEIELCFNQQILVTVICIISVILSLILFVLCWILYFAYSHKSTDISKISKELINDSQKLVKDKNLAESSFVTV